MSKMRAMDYVFVAILSVLLTSCAQKPLIQSDCGPVSKLTATSFPATPTYGTAAISTTTINALSPSPVEFDRQLRSIVGVSNLEDAYIGCENGLKGDGSPNTCSSQLNYDSSAPVTYTFVRELNPKACRFMRALDAAQKVRFDEKLTAKISVYQDQGACVSGCVPCVYCAKKCTPVSAYPQCAAGC